MRFLNIFWTWFRSRYAICRSSYIHIIGSVLVEINKNGFRSFMDAAAAVVAKRKTIDKNKTHLLCIDNFDPNFYYCYLLCRSPVFVVIFNYTATVARSSCRRFSIFLSFEYKCVKQTQIIRIHKRHRNHVLTSILLVIFY